MSYKLQRDSDGVRYHGVPFETKDGKNLGGQISGGFTENEELRALLLNEDGSINLDEVVTELGEVKSELESIKNGTMQVRDDSLADKIDSLIDRQESLESKLDSVIEDESVNARLTGSSDELEVVDVTPLVTEKRVFDRVKLLPGERMSETFYLDVSNVSAYAMNDVSQGLDEWVLTLAYRAGQYGMGYLEEYITSHSEDVGSKGARLQTIKKHDAPTRGLYFRIENNSDIEAVYTAVILKWRS